MKKTKRRLGTREKFSLLFLYLTAVAGFLFGGKSDPKGLPWAIVGAPFVLAIALVFLWIGLFLLGLVIRAAAGSADSEKVTSAEQLPLVQSFVTSLFIFIRLLSFATRLPSPSLTFFLILLVPVASSLALYLLVLKKLIGELPAVRKRVGEEIAFYFWFLLIFSVFICWL